jgi:hypothetical protein
MDEPTPAPAAPPLQGCFRTIGLTLAVPAYLIILYFLLSFERRNPEDGMMVGLLIIMVEPPLWLGLGAFLAAALKQAPLDRRYVIGTWLLFGGAAIVSFLALSLMGTDPDWLSVVPAGLPLLFFGFGMWAREGSKNVAERRKVLIGFPAAVIALFALYAAALALDMARTARSTAEAESQISEYEADYERNLRSAPRLEALLDYLHDGDRQERTLAAISRLPSRQADTIRLLGADRMHENLWWLHRFNLHPDVALCGAYRTAFDRMVERLHLTQGVHPSELHIQSENYTWLSRNGCDLAPSFRSAAARLRRFNQESTTVQAADLEALANGAAPAQPQRQ